MRSRPTASSALLGTATIQPGLWTNCTSLVWLCHGSPHLKKPPGTRSTIGAAKRLAVRQRMVPVSLICSVAGSAYLRNWISGTGSSPASAMPDRAADDAFLVEAGVEDPVVAVFVLQPERHRMDAALGTDVLAEHAHARIGAEFLVEHLADGGDHVDPLALGARLVMGAVEGQARAWPPTSA